MIGWEPRYRDALDRVLGPSDALCGQMRPAFGPAQDGPCWRFTLVAEQDGNAVGAAIAFAPRWHPQRLWVSVEVGAAHRRQGIGTALLDAVRQRSSADGRPLRAKVFASSPGSHFAAARGFKVIQRSRTFRLDGDRLASPSELVVETPADRCRTASAFLDFYRSTHRWDPPGQITVDDVMEVHLADAITTILVSDAHGQALAVGCLYEENDGLNLSGGPTSPISPDSEAACAALLDSVPRPVLVEADDSVPAMIAALATRNATVADEVHVVAED